MCAKDLVAQHIKAQPAEQFARAAPRVNTHAAASHAHSCRREQRGTNGKISTTHTPLTPFFLNLPRTSSCSAEQQRQQAVRNSPLSRRAQSTRTPTILLQGPFILRRDAAILSGGTACERVREWSVVLVVAAGGGRRRRRGGVSCEVWSERDRRAG